MRDLTSYIDSINDENARKKAEEYLDEVMDELRKIEMVDDDEYHSRYFGGDSTLQNRAVIVKFLLALTKPSKD